MDDQAALAVSPVSDHAAFGAPPPVLYETYQRLLAAPSSYQGQEQRCEPRHSTALRAVVVPLNEQGEASGQPFVCLTNNISASGLSLLHTSAVSEPLLEVELDDPGLGQLRGTLEVLRCRAVGDCFEIAGRFLRSDRSAKRNADSCCGVVLTVLLRRPTGFFPASFGRLLGRGSPPGKLGRLGGLQLTCCFLIAGLRVGKVGAHGHSHLTWFAIRTDSGNAVEER